LITLRNACQEDCRMFWDWRNEQSARNVSFHPETVPWEEHVTWFQQNLNAAGVRMQVAMDLQHRPIGQVRYEIEDDEATISVSIGSEWRGRGLGSRLIRQSGIILFATSDVRFIRAHIRDINTSSMRVFEKCGYKKSDPTMVHSLPSYEYILHRPTNQRIAISQPTYLPWIGYLDQIDSVDTFVLLDNVQFEKQTWQQRNRIKTPTGLQWLSVPVIFKGRFGQHINEVEIREDFAAQHLRAIELNYRRAPYFDRYFPALSALLQRFGQGMRLADLNSEVIDWLMEVLGIHFSIIRASSLPCEGKRSSLLVNICKRLNATEYLAAAGSADYLLSDLHLFSQQCISVSFHNYNFPQYAQCFPPFIPHACALDLLFNEGPRAVEILRSGHQGHISAEQKRKIMNQEASV
jgi:RimJ/RimL family protein N-acetyltransferase